MSGFAEIEEIRRDFHGTTDRAYRVVLIEKGLAIWNGTRMWSVSHADGRGSRMSKRERRARKMWWRG